MSTAAGEDAASAALADADGQIARAHRAGINGRRNGGNRINAQSNIAAAKQDAVAAADGIGAAAVVVEGIGRIEDDIAIAARDEPAAAAGDDAVKHLIAAGVIGGNFHGVASGGDGYRRIVDKGSV